MPDMLKLNKLYPKYINWSPASTLEERQLVPQRMPADHHSCTNSLSCRSCTDDLQLHRRTVQLGQEISCHLLPTDITFITLSTIYYLLSTTTTTTTTSLLLTFIHFLISHFLELLTSNNCWYNTFYGPDVFSVTDSTALKH